MSNWEWLCNQCSTVLIILVILLQAVQQWPPLQRAVVPDDEEDSENVAGINIEAAKEHMRREDQEFDKKEHSRKIKERHRVRQHFPVYYLHNYNLQSDCMPCSKQFKGLNRLSLLNFCFTLWSDLQCVLKVYRPFHISSLL